MAAGTPEGAMEMSGGGESAGMGAMDVAFADDTADTAPPADDPADAVMDQAMDPDDAPACRKQVPNQLWMKQLGQDIVDPGMGGDQDSR